MDRALVDRLLSLGTALSFLGGIALIIVGRGPIAILGFVLIILSVVLFFPRMKDFLVKRDERA